MCSIVSVIVGSIGCVIVYSECYSEFYSVSTLRLYSEVTIHARDHFNLI